MNLKKQITKFNWYQVFMALFLLQWILTMLLEKKFIIIEFILMEHNCEFPFIFYPIIIACIIKFIFPKFTILSCLFIAFVMQWILFLNVNPYPISMDNKLAVMNNIPEKFRPEIQYSLVDISDKSIEYPIIIKPIICSGCSVEVHIAKSFSDLQNILNKIKDRSQYMVQNFLEDYDVEICVLFEKMPWEESGKIIEIYEKTNTNQIRNYIKYKTSNKSQMINDTTNKLFNDISKLVPGLNTGRYDIRLKSIDDLEKGEFKIVEINGTMGMSLFPGVFDNWLLSAYLHLKNDTFWHLRRVLIGASNIILMRGYSLLNLPIAMFKSYKSMTMCCNWENLFSLYS